MVNKIGNSSMTLRTLCSSRWSCCVKLSKSSLSQTLVLVMLRATTLLKKVNLYWNVFHEKTVVKDIDFVC